MDIEQDMMLCETSVQQEVQSVPHSCKRNVAPVWVPVQQLSDSVFIGIKFNWQKFDDIMPFSSITSFTHISTKNKGMRKNVHSNEEHEIVLSNLV